MCLDATHEQKLIALLRALINQEQARIIVSPYENASGFWFGGGNLARDNAGTLRLIGRGGAYAGPYGEALRAFHGFRNCLRAYRSRSWCILWGESILSVYPRLP